MNERLRHNVSIRGSLRIVNKLTGIDLLNRR